MDLSFASARAALSAAGDCAGGRGRRHSVRSLLAAAARALVDSRRRRAGRLGCDFWLDATIAPGRQDCSRGNVALLLAVAATAAAWHHCRWYLFAADDLGCYARRKAQPVCVEATAVRCPARCRTPPLDPMRMMPPTEGFAARRRLGGDARRRRVAAGLGPGDAAGAGPAAAGPRRRSAALFCATFPRRSARKIPGRSTMPPTSAPRACAAGCRRKCPNAFRWFSPAGWLSLAAFSIGCEPTAIGCWRTIWIPRCAEMAEAVLLGEREQVDSGRTENFMATGTIHLLVIAGLHVGILAGALFWIVRRTPLPHGWAIAAGGGGDRLLHVPGRCRAAGGAGDRVGAGDVRGRLLGPDVRCASTRWPPRRWSCWR